MKSMLCNIFARIAGVLLLCFSLGVCPIAAVAAEFSGDGIVDMASIDATSFLYIDEAEIDEGSAQNIVFVASESIDKEVLSAELTIESSDNDTLIGSFPAVEFDGRAMLFSFDTSGFSAQAYKVSSIVVRTERLEYRINFADSDVCSFEVISRIGTFGSSNRVHGRRSMGTTVFTLDENGEFVDSGFKNVSPAMQSMRLDSSRPVVVALDPGHGGYDSGALAANGAHEADLTWKIAEYCKESLENEFGTKVILTRSKNECPSLLDRAKRANAAGATVLVSIHLNAGGGVGSEVWVPNNSKYNSETHSVGSDLAKKILSQLASLGLRDRGVKTKDYPAGSGDSMYPDGSPSDYYGVIREARRMGLTGIIVEHAFIDNASDFNKFLSSDAKLRDLGVADAKGIADYFNLSANLEEKYSDVFDYDYYIANYPDVKRAFGSNRMAVVKHFIDFGMAEGRRGNSDFDLASYFKRYADLRCSFGLDLKAYYLHYMMYGKNEGRSGKAYSGEQVFATGVNDVDYSDVYDPKCYLNSYVDMKEISTCRTAFVELVDDYSLLRHFINYGMSEGRIGNPQFDVSSYYNRNCDLRRAFGSNLKLYYLHYIKFGKNEGRLANGTSELIGYSSMQGNSDYAPVYEGKYYASHYHDVKEACTFKTSFVNLLDDGALLRHFINFGMKEGRRGCDGFYVKYYRVKYPDLNLAFGSDLELYFAHYLKYGIWEGRSGAGDISDDEYEQAINADCIMGLPRTSASRMAEFYRLRVGASRYPSEIYRSKGAASIDEFCRIVCEEAKTEGVRPEVVFCQSMHETGWLRFGGQVKANQCNFAGLGADNSGASGAVFPDVRTGIRAQVQHLKAYASKEPLVNACVDPRFALVKRGIAPKIVDLNNRWAVPGTGYGQSILKLISELMAV